MKNLYVLIISIFLILSCSNDVNNQKVLTIVHVNDTHSKNKEFITISKEDGSTNRYAGAARRKTFIDNVKKENKNVIVMHAGDTIAGSVFSIVYQGMDEAELMNDMGFNVSTLGNHEFDFGIEQLNNIISNRNFPTIACNVKVKATGENYVLPYIVTNINGIHTAIVGVLQSEKMNIIQGLDYIDIEDEVTSIKNLLAEIPLNTTNDITILLSHAGFDTDKKIAQEIPNTFNIIIGGHTHTLLDAPVVIGNTTIVQTGEYGEYIGTIDVIFKNGKYAYPEYKLNRLDENIKEDENILAKINQMQIEVDKEFNIEIAKLPYELTDENVRNKSTALGNFVSDIAASSQEGIDIALINSGSLRGKLPSGKVTLGNMYEFFPFDNLIILTTLNGKDLKNILELSASRKGEGAFLQVSKDCIINFDSNGKLLESYIKGKSINDNEKYVVAVADYIFNGGEKYIDESGKPLFQYGENTIHTGLDIRDLIIKTLKEYKNVPESAIDNTARIIFK
ncbi:putative 5'-nucleotidase [Brachyspira hampsonii 30446]|uniref:Putative 5'-nucleotidase n=2 Tax=Brachyspira hampsonii TaxID=1287055 RepID=A0A2U4EVW0_9SPIR|nr:bifunctional UDP-sugar hydrolase/5'-nucleotidase [Brachyspira hampsonii]EKV57058.1 putative 5'-nucleotidase [Brachyspira hampsonii 30446]MBW5394754.1 bifunctional metallophosphatase/5'-nucleotidase [Brachyspira hampsonii]OEJ19273.1 multifunctional 2',3'-cyclic-nucleotide 2'-phosphodiesterase/5'-nucleotidase/3'-nucleotidase [Brachyspira hampsonii]